MAADEGPSRISSWGARERAGRAFDASHLPKRVGRACYRCDPLEETRNHGYNAESPDVHGAAGRGYSRAPSSTRPPWSLSESIPGVCWRAPARFLFVGVRARPRFPGVDSLQGWRLGRVLNKVWSPPSNQPIAFDDSINLSHEEAAPAWIPRLSVYPAFEEVAFSARRDRFRVSGEAQDLYPRSVGEKGRTKLVA